MTFNMRPTAFLHLSYLISFTDMIFSMISFLLEPFLDPSVIMARLIKISKGARGRPDGSGATSSSWDAGSISSQSFIFFCRHHVSGVPTLQRTGKVRSIIITSFWTYPKLRYSDVTRPVVLLDFLTISLTWLKPQHKTAYFFVNLWFSQDYRSVLKPNNTMFFITSLCLNFVYVQNAVILLEFRW